VTAHLVYGASLAIVMGELGRQVVDERVHPRSLRARVG
jgi:hypothetical protein